MWIQTSHYDGLTLPVGWTDVVSFTRHKWLRGDSLHRADGPAFVDEKFVENTQMSRQYRQELYKKYIHNWPADRGLQKLYSESGNSVYNIKTMYQAWYQNDVRHRADGPAVIGVNIKSEWWYRGVQETELANRARRRAMLCPLHVWLPVVSVIAYPLVDLAASYTF
jgi:hypothetical protein